MSERETARTAAMTKVQAGVRRKWVKWGMVSALLLSLPTYMFLADEYYYRIVRYDMSDRRGDGRLPDADLEKSRNHKPLTSADIENYLHDATFIGSNNFTPHANIAIHAGLSHDYVEWEEGRHRYTTGHWATRWILEHRVWENRSEWQFAQVFCFNVDEDADGGYCIVADNYDQIFGFIKQPRRISGDPLGIRAGERAPDDLAARVNQLRSIDAPDGNN